MIKVQSEPLNAGEEINTFLTSNPNSGGIATFIGQVRDFQEQGSGESASVAALELEHYPGMTEKAIGKIVDEAVARWSLTDALVIHRYGALKTGEQIMMVATASAHRAAAFEAADFLMDYLKSRAPFWKKEVTEEGAAWVAAKDEDEDALGRW